MQLIIRAGWIVLLGLAIGIFGQQLLARQEVINESKDPNLEVVERAILAPADGVDRTAWLDAMRRWRTAERKRTNYDGSAYNQADTQWTRRNFYQTLMMVEDRYFYDPVAGKYTVDRYLDDLESRFGGIDSIILWAVYPNIGIDNRNQNDHLHDLPGGLDAVKNAVADFHRRGVRVVLPIMPWDTGTRAKSAPGWKMLLDDIRRIDADGVFGDTMVGMSEELKNAMNESGRMLALQPEVEAPDCAFAAGNIISWGSWPFQVPKPSVSKYKWFEPRHQINLCHRWETDRTDQLQTAFFNGIGYEVWENIWGIWNGLTPRDCHALRRIAAIQRTLADLMVGADWEPYAPTLRESEGVFAAKFPGRGQTLYVLVNRGEKTLDGKQIRVPMKPGTRYFDLWHGTALQPETAGTNAVLSFGIEGRGYGAVLAVDDGKPAEEVESLLARTTEWSKTKLTDLSAEWKPLPQRIVEIERTPPAGEAPEGMVAVPAGKFRFRVSGVMIEGGDEPGVDVQYPWEDFPRRHHDKELDIDAFYIDKYPVTNAEFKRFLDAAGYRPRDGHNFLRDWKDGTYPPGWGKKPVTWVSIEDARSYAAWAGKRLPHEWEWQYAAQGTDGRPFPWGKEPDPEAMPKPDDAPELRGPDDVDAHPRGASPFGAMDMMGNIWHWTDEYRDEHTRAAVLRGGSYYRPAKGWWYFPRNTKLDQHGKYLLMAPSRDRSGTIGFRCVVDRRFRRLPLKTFRDKMQAAWIGQMAGVGWGAPTEFGYIGQIIPEDAMPKWRPDMINQHGNDDCYVEMTFLKTLEDYGLNASIRQAGIDFANSGYQLWHANLAGRENLRQGIAPPDSGHPEFNRHADDIDYQIESDFAGIISPGLPNQAVALGEKFGRLMNYGDGLYAGQFVAAMYAESYFESNPVKLIESALRSIPAECQYAEMVRDMLRWQRENPDDWQQAWRLVEDKYHKNPQYTHGLCSQPGGEKAMSIDAKLNGAYILMGLLYGRGEPDRTITISCRCGQDSDCNPSNAAGVLFAAKGTAAVPPKFVERLDLKAKFSHTPYDLPKVYEVCEKLARAGVIAAGGRIEKTPDGEEVFVIPVQTPKPSKPEAAYAPGPSAGSRFSDEEMAKIRPPK